jgi:hypothetical protein
MKHSMYLRYDIIRTMRNRRVLIFSLAFPLVLFLIIGGTNRHAHVEGIAFPTYYMTGMVAWGTIIAVVSTGARIAAERQIGWSRQLRITPLPTSVYFRAKVVSAYISAALSIIVLYLAGTVLGVRLSAGQWLTMTGLLLRPGALRCPRRPARPPPLRRFHGPGYGRDHGFICSPRRRLGPSGHQRHAGDDREGYPVLLAGPSEPDRRSRQRLAAGGVARPGHLDGGPSPAGHLRLQA